MQSDRSRVVRDEPTVGKPDCAWLSTIITIHGSTNGYAVATAHVCVLTRAGAQNVRRGLRASTCGRMRIAHLAASDWHMQLSLTISSWNSSFARGNRTGTADVASTAFHNATRAVPSSDERVLASLGRLCTREPSSEFTVQVKGVAFSWRRGILIGTEQERIEAVVTAYAAAPSRSNSKCLRRPRRCL